MQYGGTTGLKCFQLRVWGSSRGALPSSSLATIIYLTLMTVAILGVLGVVEAIRQIVVQRIGARLEVDAGQRLLAASLNRTVGAGADAAGLLRDLAQCRADCGSAELRMFVGVKPYRWSRRPADVRSNIAELGLGRGGSFR